MCALKPLRKIDNGVVVQWHWLKQTTLKPKTLIADDDDFLGRAGLVDQAWGEQLAHRRSGMVLKTGQTFTIMADNPDDVPSFELLEMHWDLLRIAAISGAAGLVAEDYLDDDEHGDDGGVGVSEGYEPERLSRWERDGVGAGGRLSY